MADKRNENTELNELREENRELCKTLGEHLLRRMLASWFIVPLGFTIFFLVIFTLISTGVIITPHIPIISLDFAILKSVNSDVFIGTLTFAGLIVGIVPIISFFYLGELKDRGMDIIKSIKERMRGQSAEIKKLLQTQEYLYDVLLTNMRKAVKQYTQATVAFSVFSLLGLVLAYVITGSQNAVNSGTGIMADNLALNIMLSIQLLFYIAMEVFPLVGLALYDSGYRVIRFKERGRQFTLVTSE